METVTLTRISRFMKDKDGNPLKTKDGRPYTRVIIQTEEHEKPLSGFETPATKSWDVGTKADIEVTQKGEYFNFSLPKKEAVQTEDMKAMKEDVEKILLRLGRILNLVMIVEERTNVNKKKVAPDARDRTPGDNVTAFDEPSDSIYDRNDEEPPF